MLLPVTQDKNTYDLALLTQARLSLLSPIFLTLSSYFSANNPKMAWANSSALSSSTG